MNKNRRLKLIAVVSVVALLVAAGALVIDRNEDEEIAESEARIAPEIAQEVAQISQEVEFRMQAPSEHLGMSVMSVAAEDNGLTVQIDLRDPDSQEPSTIVILQTTDEIGHLASPANSSESQMEVEPGVEALVETGESVAGGEMVQVSWRTEGVTKVVVGMNVPEEDTLMVAESMVYFD